MTLRLSPLPRRWEAVRDDGWRARATPVRPGEVLMYYDGEQIMTQWSAQNEEFLWVRQDDGAAVTRWLVAPLTRPALDHMVERGTFKAAFAVQPNLLLVDQRHATTTASGAPSFDRYEVRTLPLRLLDELLGASPFMREVAEWARARRTLNPGRPGA